MPKVSVVMPVYNGEEYLPEAMESVLNQTMRDFEFIIVEEFGNSSECHGILERYAAQDRRIKLIQNTSRLGIAESLNVGLQASSGEYIARMDGDDISGLDRFQVQSAFMDLYPDIDICGIIPTVINSPGWIVENSTDPEKIKSAMLFSLPIKHPTAMFRRESFQKSGIMYDPSLPGTEDYDLFLRASLYLKMTNLREPTLFYYRRTGENASAVNFDRDMELGRTLLRKFYKSNFNITMSPIQNQCAFLFNRWPVRDAKKQIEALIELEALFSKMLHNQHIQETYQSDALMESMRRKWRKVYTQIKSANGGEGKTDKRVKDVYRASVFYRP